jgi:hypothetical protein
MKTQINSLINGAKRVRRLLSEAKYVNAPKSSNVGDYAGSNYDLRASIAENVLKENPDGMDIEILGDTLHLNLRKSLSGQSYEYYADISEEQFMKYSGFQSKPFQFPSKFAIVIDQNMFVALHKWTQKNENTEWHFRGFDFIDESFVTIL